jgi:hypothetical protein
MRRSPYTSLREGLVAAWCPSLDLNTNSGVGITDRSPYKRNLAFDMPISLPNYWQYQDVPALNFSGINTGSDARTSNLSGFPLPGSQVTLACWNYVSAYGDGLGYSYNSACIELATDWQRFILQNYNEPGINNYVFTDAVFGENNLQTTYELPAKQWYHFAITINEFSEYVFYLNGVPHISGQFPIALEPATSYHVQIGRREGYDTFYGYLDDIRVYNRVLQPSEVWTLSQVRGAGLEPLPRERRGLFALDTSDILDRGLRRKQNTLTQKEEEQIAAQLLRERQLKTKSTNKIKKAVDWKNLILEKINGVQTTDELNAISITTESVEVTAAVLAEIEQKKELKRIELELAQKEAELKALELTKAIEDNEKAIALKLKEQEHQLQILKGLQDQVFERLRLAEATALEEERKAAYEAQIAEQRYLEFKQKRDNRIKRLKALMWLAKLDI